MDLTAVLIIEVLNGIASLALICVGLGVIFGMMRVINFAHGEFIMLGGYAAITATNQFGINIWISMLIVAPIVVGIIGLIAERFLIRYLYGRMIDTLLATWGLSLFLIGVVTAIYGNTTTGISAPLGSFNVGIYSIALYRIVLILLTIVIFLAIFLLFKRTKLGLIARGTMQNPSQASVLGISPPRVYMVTFGLGTALTGLAGGLLAPISGVIPTIGLAYVAKAFITVISGGAAALTGTATASTLYGTISQLVTYQTTPIIGQIALLLGAIILLRFMPQGITGKFFKGGL